VLDAQLPRAGDHRALPLVVSTWGLKYPLSVYPATLPIVAWREALCRPGVEVQAQEEPMAGERGNAGSAGSDVDGGYGSAPAMHSTSRVALVNAVSTRSAGTVEPGPAR